MSSLLLFWYSKAEERSFDGVSSFGFMFRNLLTCQYIDMDGARYLLCHLHRLVLLGLQLDILGRKRFHWRPFQLWSHQRIGRTKRSDAGTALCCIPNGLCYSYSRFVPNKRHLIQS